ncbi:hypothetical protein [Naasia aerilata]|uniref:Uncharacterized protein n=1 Tax=Naasia aerilata TaxID=1162966 RepID=A0ABM8GGR2_9MICO|nr:hypothetical protein [Naasia aerilata]BDZ47548.1 hypothetical protein GCM10025866_34570 [Naasia aerilata]
MIPSVLAVLYVVLLVLAAAAAAGLSVAAWWRPTPPLVYASVAAVAAALLLSAVPAGDPGFAVDALITVLALAAAIVGGGPAATTALRMATRGSVADGDHGGIIQDGSEVLRGGTAIGLLERLAVAAVIIAGFPEGLAVIVAIKGVGRFTELDAAAPRERFIIGTFASLIWAAACAGIAVLARA